ncbi:hypothetical protein ADK52_22850 [Streptomyces sp. WM6372]|nr:hypothetical protein ADK52_22850 [Streptomyces sp. WM6372]
MAQQEVLQPSARAQDSEWYAFWSSRSHPVPLRRPQVSSHISPVHGENLFFMRPASRLDDTKLVQLPKAPWSRSSFLSQRSSAYRTISTRSVDLAVGPAEPAPDLGRQALEAGQGHGTGPREVLLLLRGQAVPPGALEVRVLPDRDVRPEHVEFDVGRLDQEGRAGAC